MTGRCKTLFAWGVIAVAGLIYLASLLPVVAAMEEGGVVVSDQLPSSARDTFSMIMDGTGEPQADTATTDTEISRPEGDAGLGTQFSTTPATAPQETAVTSISCRLRQTKIRRHNIKLRHTTPAESGEQPHRLGELCRVGSNAHRLRRYNANRPGIYATEPDEAEPVKLISQELDAADPEVVSQKNRHWKNSWQVCETRLGLVLYGSTGFPITDVDATGNLYFISRLLEQFLVDQGQLNP